MFKKKSAAMLVAELVGTAVLTLAVISVLSSGIYMYSLFVGLGAGLTLAVLMYIFSDDSGGHFNPALTVGLWTARKIKTLPAIAYVVVQLVGGWAGYRLYAYFTSAHAPAPSQHWVTRALFAEAAGMFVFALGWAVAAARKYRGAALATTVGGAFAVGIMITSLALPSRAAINPAIALGARFWDIWGSAGWIYVAGPLIGSIIGINLYNMLMAGGSVKPLNLKPVTATKKKK